MEEDTIIANKALIHYLFIKYYKEKNHFALLDTIINKYEKIKY
jgi:hypothetical protein